MNKIKDLHGDFRKIPKNPQKQCFSLKIKHLQHNPKNPRRSGFSVDKPVDNFILWFSGIFQDLAKSRLTGEKIPKNPEKSPKIPDGDKWGKKRDKIYPLFLR